MLSFLSRQCVCVQLLEQVWFQESHEAVKEINPLNLTVVSFKCCPTTTTTRKLCNNSIKPSGFFCFFNDKYQVFKAFVNQVFTNNWTPAPEEQKR